MFIISFFIVKPKIPTNLQVTETLSNSVRLSWMSPPFTGTNITYILNVNKTYNITINENSDENQDPVKQVEIKSLQPEKIYEFKILAFNPIGHSKFSTAIRARTLKTFLEPHKLPELKLAQFNDIREAICFDIEQRSNENLKGLVVKIDINTASGFYNQNKTSEMYTNTKSYLISLNKLKFGQNCILFPQILAIDKQRQRLKTIVTNGHNLQTSFNIIASNQTKNSNVYSLNDANKKELISSSTLGKSFFEFKNLNRLNVSICYSNDTYVCSDKLPVNDFSADFSIYVTLIAIGCSAILILIILLIASVCCCFCCSRKQKKTTGKDIKKGGVPLDQNLVIKSFPAVPINQQKLSFDYSDESTKSSQQNILSGSNDICTHSSSSSASQKYYMSNQNKIIDMYDPNVQNRYIYNHNQQNTSSIATVESDISSSGTKSSQNHSPCTVLSSENTNIASLSSSSYTNVSKVSNKPQQQQTTFLYNGTNYIKTQTMSQQLKQMHAQFVSSGNTGSPESGYSTPINHGNSTTTKKLVYEVIV